MSRATALVMLLGCGVALSCESSVEEKPGQSCAERDKTYAVDASFPFGESNPRQVPECVPTCGEHLKDVDGFLSITALPAGKCSRNPECAMGAYKPCACAPQEGPVDDYRCSCKNGSWACRVVVPGGSACPTCNDGG